VPCAEADQEANDNGTACRCVNHFYDRKTNGLVRCAAGDHHRAQEAADGALPTCMPCHGLSCLDCAAEDPQIRPGHARVQAGAAATIEVFRCPADPADVGDGEAACHGTTVAAGAACAAGHTGPLCQVCEQAFARSGGHC
jgi:hypothetical protein